MKDYWIVLVIFAVAGMMFAIGKLADDGWEPCMTASGYQLCAPRATQQNHGR